MAISGQSAWITSLQNAILSGVLFKAAYFAIALQKLTQAGSVVDDVRLMHGQYRVARRARLLTQIAMTGEWYELWRGFDKRRQTLLSL
jgi:hypothetical protein